MQRIWRSFVFLPNNFFCFYFDRISIICRSSQTMLDETRRLNSFLRKTRRGHVLKITHELYLRDDIPCGSQICRQCSIDSTMTTLDRQLNNGNQLVQRPHYLVVDTNIVLQQVKTRKNSNFSTFFSSVRFVGRRIVYERHRSSNSFRRSKIEFQNSFRFRFCFLRLRSGSTQKFGDLQTNSKYYRRSRTKIFRFYQRI